MALSAYHRRGTILIYGAISLVLFCAFVSLAVDFGRVQLAKTELRRNADAAARAAVANLGSGVTAAQDAAINVASLNPVDGGTITLDRTNDIEFINWDTSTGSFTILTGAAQSSANAVRVWSRRTTANGNPLQLTFARVLGRQTFDVSAFAIAFCQPQYAFVGLDSVTISGNGNVDSYNSSTGDYPPVTSDHRGSLASNGSINLAGNAVIDGDTYLPAGKSVSQSGESTILGSQKVLTQTMVYSAPTLPASYTPLGAVTSTGGDIYLPAGDYYATSVNVSGGATMYFQGPVRLYISGDMTMSGAFFNTYQNKPGNLQIFMLSSRSISLSGQAALYARIYAPLSALTQSGKANVYGSIIAKTLTFSGSWDGGVHFDEAGSGSRITLVR
jgi:hypothetical protein